MLLDSLHLSTRPAKSEEALARVTLLGARFLFPQDCIIEENEWIGIFHSSKDDSPCKVVQGEGIILGTISVHQQMVEISGAAQIFSKSENTGMLL